MLGALIFIGIVAVGIVTFVTARPSIKRYMAKRRLRMAKEAEAEAARKAETRKRAEEAAAMIAGQPDYFRSYGIKVVEALSTPRAADVGDMHLTHPLRWEYWDDDGHNSGTHTCTYGCGEISEMHEIALNGPGASWAYLGRYCPKCGALSHTSDKNPSFVGPLGRRLKGATNLFDALGPPKTKDPEEAWRRLEAEEASLEARLNETRARRLALAERIGKPIDGGPFRPRIIAGDGKS